LISMLLVWQMLVAFVLVVVHKAIGGSFNFNDVAEAGTGVAATIDCEAWWPCLV
jgi:hypothetical protein